jgi:hypothetical protein
VSRPLGGSSRTEEGDGMWVVQYIQLETLTNPVLVLREILWPRNLEDRSALRKLAVIDSDGEGAKWTIEADAVRILDEAGKERLRYTRFDYESE